MIFTQFPTEGVVPGQAATTRERREGNVAWNAAAAKMTTSFPGRVMYLPMGGSVLFKGKFSTWLPPEGDQRAPKDAWIRARKLDLVHLCPEGSARYADALLTDMTALFGFAPASVDWSQGSWTSNPDYNDPPWACPDDHPPG